MGVIIELSDYINGLQKNYLKHCEKVTIIQHTGKCTYPVHKNIAICCIRALLQNE